MKQKDLFTIIIISAISAAFSFLLANVIFGGANKYYLKAPEVTPITSKFLLPNVLYFNGTSIDATQIITIGRNSDPQTSVKH